MENKYNLTDRELEVLALLTKGYRNIVIAEKLNITRHTVKAHLLSMYNKTEIHKRKKLAQMAIETGICTNSFENV